MPIDLPPTPVSMDDLVGEMQSGRAESPKRHRVRDGVKRLLGSSGQSGALLALTLAAGMMARERGDRMIEIDALGDSDRQTVQALRAGMDSDAAYSRFMGAAFLEVKKINMGIRETFSSVPMQRRSLDALAVAEGRSASEETGDLSARIGREHLEIAELETLRARLWGAEDRAGIESIASTRQVGKIHADMEVARREMDTEIGDEIELRLTRLGELRAEREHVLGDASFPEMSSGRGRGLAR